MGCRTRDEARLYLSQLADTRKRRRKLCEEFRHGKRAAMASSRVQSDRPNQTLFNSLPMRRSGEAPGNKNMAIKKASGPLSPLYRNSSPSVRAKPTVEVGKHQIDYNILLIIPTATRDAHLELYATYASQCFLRGRFQHALIIGAARNRRPFLFGWTRRSV